MTKIVLDAGHGGTDPGAVGNSLLEKNIVLKIVRLTKAYLEKNFEGVTVLESRPTDVFVELDDRTDFANNHKADSLVSVHVNAGTAQANGYEDFRYSTDGETSKSAKLQGAIHKNLAPLWTGKGRKNRGQKKANFHMVREFKGAAVLVELGFISNREDASLLKQESFLQANATGLAKALASYHGLKAKKAPVKAPAKAPVKTVVKAPVKPKAPTSVRLVEITYKGADGLDVRTKADYNLKKVDTVHGGTFTIKRKVKAKLQNGEYPYMYQLKSGVYITANPKYVREYTK